MALSLKQQHIWSQLRRYWELLHILVARNLKQRYRGSFLGVYWSLLNPLIMTLVYTGIFGETFAVYYGNSMVTYILAAFTGFVVTNFFASSTSQTLAVVVNNGSLLNKIRLPVSIFPVSTIAANIFQFTVGTFPFLAIVTFIYSRNLVNVLALFLPFIALILVSTGIGFLISALYVFFRDLPYFYEIAVLILWISSPVFYPTRIVPAGMRPFLALNPLPPIIESMRQIILSGNLPDLSLVLGAILNGLIVLLIGWGLFKKLQPHFMDLL